MSNHNNHPAVGQFIISEEDHALLGHAKNMAGLLATGMAHTTRSAEAIPPAQVESVARCLETLIGTVMQSAIQLNDSHN